MRSTALVSQSHHAAGTLFRLALLACLLPGVGQSTEPQALGSTTEARDAAYSTQNVVLVSIDGLNNAEAFDTSNPAELIPNLTRLASQGALYRNVYNLGGAWPSAANYGIVDGTLEVAAPSMYYYRHFRPSQPTVFEYYRKAHPGVTQEQVWAVPGTRDCTLIEHSSHPAYGAAYAASIDGQTMNSSRPDQRVLEIVRARMEQHQPSLLFAQFGGVAEAAEKYGWGGYLQAISRVDGLIGQLWDWIQSDPSYRNVTTLLVTSSHGWAREENGCLSESCKRLFLMAIGPDIRAGVEFTSTQCHADIVPTVGELLGFPTPYSEGRTLSKMLLFDGTPEADPLPSRSSWLKTTLLTAGEGRVEWPRLAANAQGLHVLWVDDRSGLRQVYYRHRAAQGEAWSDSEAISASTWEARAPAIAASGETAHAVFMDYQDGQWAVVYRQRSADGIWSPPEIVERSAIRGELVSQMVWEPAVVTCGVQVAVAVPLFPHWLRVYRRDPQGRWSGITLVDASRRTEVDNRIALPQHLSMVSNGRHFLLLWQEVAKITWGLKFARSEGCSDDWIRDALPPTFVFGAQDGALAADGPVLHAAWTVLEQLDWDTPPHDTARTRSTDGGRSWELASTLLSTPVRGISLAAGPGTAAMAWEDYRSGIPRVRLSLSEDGGLTWSDQDLSGGEVPVADPATALQGENVCVLWRALRNGEWRLVLAELGPGDPTPTPSFSATASPTPSPSLTDTSTPSATPSSTSTAPATATSSPSATPVRIFVYLPTMRRL